MAFASLLSMQGTAMQSGQAAEWRNPKAKDNGS